MPSEIQIYKTNEFIRLNESGEIDFEKSIEIVRKLAATVSFNPNHNILIDLRKTTTVVNANMGVVMGIVMEFVRNIPPSFQSKIASMIPKDKDRLANAKLFEAGMKAHDFEYKVFTNFEDAIEWISELKNKQD